jgi:parvulin-like peptidyl-prolyl isomerase
MKTMLSFSVLVLSCLVASCSRSPSRAFAEKNLGGDVLAVVAGHGISLSEFKTELEHRSRGGSSHYPLPEQREALLNEMIDSEAVFVRAKAERFDQRPEVARQIKRLIVSQFVEARLTAEKQTPAVTDAELQDYYNAQGEKFATPEQVHFAVIAFRVSAKATEEKKTEANTKAEQVLAEARSLPDSERAFGLLAQKYSEDQATRYSGGDAGWVSRNGGSRWAPEVIQAAFALKKRGELAPLVSSANGCYLIKLMDKKEAGHRPLPEVKDAVRYDLAQQKRARSQREFFDSMKSDLSIEINRPLLQSITPPTMQAEAKPPRTPAG